MPQQIAMKGDDVTPEELQGNEWFFILKRGQESRAKSHAARQSGTQRGVTAMPNATLRRVAAASRLPAMPCSHNRVIVSQGGGLNVQACSPHRILAALTMAAQLAPSVTEEDIICANSMQNIFVVSTPSATNAAAYSRVTEIILTDQRHPVTAYLSPAGITSRAVIRGVDTDYDDAALNRMLIQPRNSSLLGARRIKNTETVILIFNGLKVPNYVYCGQAIYRCTLYKRQIDTCRTCGQVGHRQDVCPTPSTKVCDHCGHLPTDNLHVFNQPVCVLCGEAHRTGDHECRHRYQLPYLVRRRRQRRHRRKQAQQQTPTPAPSPVPAKTTEPQGSPLGTRNPTSTDQPTWADKVGCKVEACAAQRRRHSPQQPDPELAQLKRMYAEQAKEIRSLKEELSKQQAPESRKCSIISGPVSIRGAKEQAGPTLQAKEQSKFDRFSANIYAILEQYRAQITAEYSAFNAKLESMQKQLIELAAWPAQTGARTKVLEEDLARSKHAELIPRP
ncbi:hypothetical protein HPB51_005804 [Rhipicephalus microplus]|uniref:CCHC-type domain-containing protein n=1 Tax=Rhipicephalus microplus TaxID=6941 RepID=A0A9J6ERJ6_RHIMP|nr:hypothetical protein HPB51_005804 [Rhipicephalus microplus]